jgi:diguanylate cyclase (GGDEF)-like protein
VHDWKRAAKNLTAAIEAVIDRQVIILKNNFPTRNRSQLFLIVFSIVFLIFGIASIVIPAYQGSQAGLGGQPLIALGKADISNWSADNGGLLSLGGEWEFYWGRLLDSDDFKSGAHEPAYAKMPELWNSMDGAASTGFATYRAIINKNPAFTRMGINLPYAYSAQKLIINDEVVCEEGVVTSSADGSHAGYAANAVYFNSDSDTVEIILQVSNFSHHLGGIYCAPIFGSQQAVYRNWMTRAGTDIALASISALAVFIFLSIYVITYKNPGYLLSAGAAFAFMLRSLLLGVGVLYDMAPTADNFLLRLEYLTLYIAIILMLLYFVNLYRENTRGNAFRALMVMNALLCLIVIFLPTRIFTMLQNVMYPAFMLNFIFIGYLIITRLKDDIPYNLINILSAAAILICAIAQIVFLPISRSLNILVIGVWVHCLIIMYMSFYSMQDANISMQRMSDSLETQISERTFELTRLNSELMRENQARQRAEHDLRQISITDSLTGIYNRLFSQQTLDLEYKRYRRYGSEYSIIMFDIDHFKRINDQFGHTQGDKVLVELSSRIGSHLRSTDIFSRWGGEEFIIIMPHTVFEVAMLAAERLLDAVSSQPYEKVGKVTASFGVASITPGETSDSLVKRADEYLYQAKNEGRNCVRGGRIDSQQFDNLREE